jgi:hypothetical protein
VIDADEVHGAAQLGAEAEHQRQLVAGVDAEIEDAGRGRERDAGERLGEIDDETRLLVLRDARERRGRAVLLCDVGDRLGRRAGERLEGQLDEGVVDAARGEHAQAEPLGEVDPDPPRPVHVGRAAALDELAGVKAAAVVGIEDP